MDKWSGFYVYTNLVSIYIDASSSVITSIDF